MKTARSSLTSDLNGLLFRSADLIAVDASETCIGSYLDEQDCAWYHSTWQYLRLMDLVSSPSWHHDFYTQALHDVVSKSPQSRILVSGTADYSMFAYALDAGIGSEITVIDMCETPLRACLWLGNEVGRHPLLKRKDVRQFANMQPGYFDCICSDAFLTRFKGKEVDEVLESWSRLLKPKGRVVTTVRVDLPNNGHKTEDAVSGFIRRAEINWTRYKGQLRPTMEGIAQRAEVYARRMTSNSLGSKEAVLEKVSQYFQIAHCETVDGRGELYPSRYTRLILEQKEV